MSHGQASPRQRRPRVQHVIGKSNDDPGQRRDDGPQSLHQVRDSLLHSGTGFDNYRGLLNWLLLLLFLSNSRLALDNLIKYGILIDPVSWLSVFWADPYRWPCTILMLLTVPLVQLMFAVEIAAHRGYISPLLSSILQRVQLLNLLVFPSVVVNMVHPNPFGSMLTMLVYTVQFMKMWSYTDANRWCRQERAQLAKEKSKKGGKSGKDTSSGSGAAVDAKDHPLLQYPDNLTTQNLWYFIAAPTLCYDLNFPRSPRIRKRFLIRRVLEVILLANVLLGLGQQWLVPTIMNSVVPFKEMSYSRMVERILKLAIPNHLLWLVFFYWFFHSFLNVTGELLRFGDRQFYKDWWNAGSMERFWSTWNIPVHKFAKRHIYQPLLDSGASRTLAMSVVFIVSAFFHEFLVSVPLGMFRVWAFAGMALQIPTGFFCNYVLHGGNWGNVVMWLSLILGQPIAALMYVHDYLILNGLLVPNGTIPANTTTTFTM